MSRKRQSKASLRAYLEYVAQLAIDLLDELHAPGEDLEDDECEILTEDDLGELIRFERRAT